MPMERTTGINAAGDFLRALKDRGGRAGGQAVVDSGALPVSDVLRLVLDEGPQPVPRIESALGIDTARVVDVLRNLHDLGLVTVEPRDGGDVVSLTDTGEVVARRQGD